MAWLIKQKYFFYLLVVCGLLAACEKPKDIGLDLQSQELVDLQFTDTVTVKTSTVFVGNTNTTNQLYLLAGKYQDPAFGKITAKGYFSIIPSSNVVDFGINPTFDSLVLSLDYAYSYGDTTKSQTLRVHILEENILEDKIYYNVSQLAYTPDPIGEVELKASNIIARTINIHLKDSFGKDLFDFLRINDQLDEKILTFLKGFALVPDQNDDAAILGFSSTISTNLKLYFHNEGKDISSFYVLGINTADKVLNNRLNTSRFNQITADRAGTKINGLTENYQTIPTADTEEQAFIQGCLGIKTKLEFPYLKNFKPLVINKAELILSPILNTSNDFLKLPASLELIQLTEAKKIATDIYSTSINGSTVQDTLPLVVQLEAKDPLDYKNPLRLSFQNFTKAYYANVTTYMQYLLNDAISNNGLLVSPNADARFVDRLVLAGSKFNQGQRTQLRLFYTSGPQN